jgi:hypothetical protein
MECNMRTITKAQRAGILERLKHNQKYSAVVAYQGKYIEKEALEFASVLEEAGWIVSGPHMNENICGEGVEIGVSDLRSPCPSAHLLLDVLVSAGLNVRLVETAEPLPSAFESSCCLQLGRLWECGASSTSQMHRAPTGALFRKTPAPQSGCGSILHVLRKSPRVCRGWMYVFTLPQL